MLFRSVKRKEVFESVIAITSFFRWLSVLFVLILGAVTIFIISNTIRMGIFARRREVNIMKFVGATNYFIREPFLIEGVGLGVLGALVSGLVLLLGYPGAASAINEMIYPLKLESLADVYKLTGLCLLAMGVGIGWLGSFVSIRKHLSV